MTVTAKGYLKISNWLETPISGVDGARQTRAQSRTVFDSGNLHGSGQANWLLLDPYPPGKPFYFVGIQNFEGEFVGRTCTFMLYFGGIFEGTGPFNGRGAHATWEAVPGSGTGGMQFSTGGSTQTGGGFDNADFTFEYYGF